MKSSNENVLDVHEVYARWLADVRKDRSSRYLYGDRKIHLENLMAYLLEYNIDQIEAQMLKRKVVEALVTDTGMKGQGKYKNWKENVENDFDDAIQIAYVPALSNVVKPIKNTMTHDPLITAWCKKTYGENVHEDLLTAAHQPGHMLWCMCLNETFKRNTGGRL